MFGCSSAIRLTKSGVWNKDCFYFPGDRLSAPPCFVPVHFTINGEGQVDKRCPGAFSLSMSSPMLVCLLTTAWTQPDWLKDITLFMQRIKQVLNKFCYTFEKLLWLQGQSNASQCGQMSLWIYRLATSLYKDDCQYLKHSLSELSVFIIECRTKDVNAGLLCQSRIW